MSSRNLFILALVAALAVGAAAQVAPAHGSSHGRGRGNKKCPTIEGCIKCRTVNGEDICTKCRAKSTWDGEYTCVCNEDYGTIDYDLFIKYWEDRCYGKRRCKKPSYKSVEGKCVKCEKYGYSSENGVCVDDGGEVGSMSTGRRLFSAADDVWAQA